MNGDPGKPESGNLLSLYCIVDVCSLIFKANQRARISNAFAKVEDNDDSSRLRHLSDCESVRSVNR